MQNAMTAADPPEDHTKADLGPTGEPFTNAFHPHFLDWLNALDLPPTSGEAGHRGPWKVEPDPATGHFAVLRQAESITEGDLPRLLLHNRQDALLAAAALPALGLRDTYALSGQAEPSTDPTLAGTCPLLRNGQPAGHCQTFDNELMPYLHALRTLCTHPEALAHLLEAAGHEAVVRAGRVLAGRVRG